MKVLKTFAWIVILAAPVLLAAHFLREQLLVDHCLDSGGSFDYVKMVCDRELDHSYVSYSDRNIGFIMAVLIAGAVAATYLVSGTQHRGPGKRATNKMLSRGR